MALAPRRLQCIPACLSRVPAVSLHHTRRGAQTLSVKFGIAHAVLVAGYGTTLFTRGNPIDCKCYLLTPP